MTEGDEGTDVFLVLDGVVRVEKDGDRLAEYGPGAILGERSGLEKGRRNSTLVTVTSCRVALVPHAVLDREQLEQLAKSHGARPNRCDDHEGCGSGGAVGTRKRSRRPRDRHRWRWQHRHRAVGVDRPAASIACSPERPPCQLSESEAAAVTAGYHPPSAVGAPPHHRSTVRYGQGERSDDKSTGGTRVGPLGGWGPARAALRVRTSTGRRYAPMAAVGVAAFGAFLAFMDSTVVNVAFPNIQAAFPHTTVSSLSWVLNAYNVVFAGLLVLSGRFADLLGRRRMFKLGLVLFIVASALCAVSTSVGMLIALRAVQAVGAAMLVPASLGIVVHASSPERRTHALSLWAAAAALAAGIGPPIGGALVDLYNWRLVFLINVPLGLLAWFLARRMVIESRAPGSRVMPDLRGALLLSLALGSVTLGIVQGGTWGWGARPRSPPSSSPQ